MWQDAEESLGRDALGQIDTKEVEKERDRKRERLTSPTPGDAERSKDAREFGGG